MKKYLKRTSVHNVIRIFINPGMFKLTIITPSQRAQNLKRIKESICFEFVSEWIIVYDKRYYEEVPGIFSQDDQNEGGKIKEFTYYVDGDVWGNGQRNYALDRIEDKDSYLYFLDDDNIMHKSFFPWFKTLTERKMYTFNNFYHQYRVVSKGNDIRIGKIDTGMLLVHYDICKDLRWERDMCDADGRFIVACKERSEDAYEYLDVILAYYNNLRQTY